MRRTSIIHHTEHVLFSEEHSHDVNVHENGGR